MESQVVEANGSKALENEQTTVEEKTQPLHLSVNEKVIFCIDNMLFFNGDRYAQQVKEICDIIMLYISFKRKISVKPVEFQCLVFHKNNVVKVDDLESLTLHSTLIELMEDIGYEEETEGFDFNIVFNYLANIVKLPSPEIMKDSIPPPYVYHCIMLFGHNVLAPVMKETNAFDFLIQSPFFHFDTIYIYNTSVDGNNCEKIENILKGLYEIVNGYCLTVCHGDVNKQLTVFIQLLGHPLLRSTQDKAKYNIKELFSLKSSED